MKMFKFILFVAIASVVACNIGADLANRVRAAAPPAQPSLGSFVQRMVTYTYSDALHIDRSQIDGHINTQKTFVMGTGQLSGRLLRRSGGGGRSRGRSSSSRSRSFRRTVHRPMVRPVIRVHGGSTRYFVPAPRFNADAFNGARTTFKPFQDLTNLKFGTNYHKIHHENQIRIPGDTWAKVTAVVASRDGSTISYKVGYGWTIGKGVQLYSTTTVRKCKRVFFFKRCWNENIRVPRGLHPGEFQLVLQGLENTLYNQVANKVASGRLLRRAGKTSTAVQTSEVYQSIQGVEISQLFDAIDSLVGQEVQLDKQSVLKGEQVKVTTNDGREHTIKTVQESENMREVQVWTKAA